MSIEAALTTWLETDPDVSDLTAGRIYPNKRPQSSTGDTCCVVYWQSQQSTLRTLTSLSGTANPTYTLDCRGRNYAEVKQLADAIRGNKTNPKLDGFRGVIGGVRIQLAQLVGGGDEAEQPVHGEERGGDHIALEFQLWYEDL